LIFGDAAIIERDGIGLRVFSRCRDNEKRKRALIFSGQKVGVAERINGEGVLLPGCAL
jgi:hypothetical protein